MKKLMLLLFISIFLLPLSADTEYVYVADGSSSPAGSAVSLPLEVDMSHVGPKVYYGFYTGVGNVQKDSNQYKLIFDESLISSDTYQSTAQFKIYTYILSGEKLTLSLKWTALYYKYTYYTKTSSGWWTYYSDSTGYLTIPVSVIDSNITSSVTSIDAAEEYVIYTFDPSKDGLLLHRDFELSATTDSYKSDDFNVKAIWEKNGSEDYTNFSQYDFSGTMQLTLKTTT